MLCVDQKHCAATTGEVTQKGSRCDVAGPESMTASGDGGINLGPFGSEGLVIMSLRLIDYDLTASG
jgi:hypothetical protein